MIKNMVFDWSGTLSDSLHRFHEICNVMFGRLGGKTINLDDIRRDFTLPYMRFWNKYFPCLTKEDEERLFDEVERQVTLKTQIYTGVEEVLRKFNSEGINMVILSSDTYSILVSEVKRADLFDLFLEINGGVHEKGPELVEIIQRNAFDREETMYVGDTSGDIEAGKYAGVRTAGIAWGYQVREKLDKADADHTVRDIYELSRVVLNP